MPESVAFQSLDSPFGTRLQIQASPHGLNAVSFLLEDTPATPDCPNTLTRRAATQLREYFAGQRKTFDLPLASLASSSDATPYRRTVWEALLNIPYGETRTYAQLATDAGGSPRAVGSANGCNAVCIVIPCHRVIRSDQGLGGYGGPLAPSLSAQMLNIKRGLLELEHTYA